MRLKNKVSIITGAAQGIGLATALKFAQEGAIVIVCDMKAAAVDAAVAQCREAGAQAEGFAVNVTDRAAVDAMVAAVKAKFGRIDVLVNNAGITQDARLQKMTIEQFDRMIDEHTYWTAVIQPRWRETANWEIYLRIIAGTPDVPPALRAFADDFRFRILNEFMNGGWGRLSADALYTRARADIDALSDFLGDKPFFMGEQPRWVDAPVLSILRHVIDTPFSFDTKDYAAGKKNLVAYMGRMKDRFGI